MPKLWRKSLLQQCIHWITSIKNSKNTHWILFSLNLFSIMNINNYSGYVCKSMDTFWNVSVKNYALGTMLIGKLTTMMYTKVHCRFAIYKLILPSVRNVNWTEKTYDRFIFKPANMLNICNGSQHIPKSNTTIHSILVTYKYRVMHL